jgi:hypothetical protein
VAAFFSSPLCEPDARVDRAREQCALFPSSDPLSKGDLPAQLPMLPERRRAVSAAIETHSILPVSSR